MTSLVGLVRVGFSILGYFGLGMNSVEDGIPPVVMFPPEVIVAELSIT